MPAAVEPWGTVKATGAPAATRSASGGSPAARSAKRGAAHEMRKAATAMAPSAPRIRAATTPGGRGGGGGRYPGGTSAYQTSSGPK